MFAMKKTELKLLNYKTTQSYGIISKIYWFFLLSIGHTRALTQTNTQTHKLTNTQTNKQTNTQTNKYKNTQTILKSKSNIKFITMCTIKCILNVILLEHNKPLNTHKFIVPQLWAFSPFLCFGKLLTQLKILAFRPS